MDNDTLDVSSLINRIDSIPLAGPYSRVKEAISGLPPSDLRALLATFLELFPARRQRIKLPQSIWPNYETDIERIRATTLNEPDEFFRPTVDRFIKDLSIAAQRMIPAGAQLVHETAIARSFLLKDSVPSAIRGALFFLKAGGFTPFYEIHTHDSTLKDFNPEGWATCYRRIADLLEGNRHVKGVFGSSWFFDPALATVSPRLSYLREIPVSGGALLLRLGSDRQSVALATTKSETRRRLHAEGKYHPTSYLIAWLRKDLIRWSKSTALPS